MILILFGIIGVISTSLVLIALCYLLASCVSSETSGFRLGVISTLVLLCVLSSLCLTHKRISHEARREDLLRAEAKSLHSC